MSAMLRSVLLALGLTTFAAAASGEEFRISLTPDQVVPPTPSTASGSGSLSLGTDGMLSYTITIARLHGTETGGSIHGPAPAGANASLLFQLPLGGTKTGKLGPLTEAQVADLRAGSWYVNIHTSHHANGEIRGQIRVLLAVQPETWSRVKDAYRSR